MNGRCETDPFDQAVDVCDSCYGEYCRNCLVDTKGRKHPICRDCTIIASGIRPGAKATRRGSKDTAKQRRAALLAMPQQDAFQYFDTALELAEAVVDVEEPTNAKRERRRLLKKKAGPPTETAGPSDADHGDVTDQDVEDRAAADTPAKTSAIHQLDTIREQSVGPSAAGSESSPGEAGTPGETEAVETFRKPRPFINDGPRNPAGSADQSPDPSPDPNGVPHPPAAPAVSAPDIAAVGPAPVDAAGPDQLPRRHRHPSPPEISCASTQPLLADRTEPLPRRHAESTSTRPPQPIRPGGSASLPRRHPEAAAVSEPVADATPAATEPAPLPRRRAKHGADAETGAPPAWTQRRRPRPPDQDRRSTDDVSDRHH